MESITSNQTTTSTEEDSSASKMKTTTTTTTTTVSDEDEQLYHPSSNKNDCNNNNNNNNSDQADDDDDDFPLTPPPAPVKPRRRRRLALLERWRVTANSNSSHSQQQQQQQLRQRRAARRIKKSAIEDFYRVDTVSAVPLTSGKYCADDNSNETSAEGVHPKHQQQQQQQQHAKQVKVLLPGVPRYEDDWARDSHDYFNLIVLVPVTVLNVMNWNWDVLFASFAAGASESANNSNHNGSNSKSAKHDTLPQTLQRAWTGDWFDVLLMVTVAYFLIDLLWIWRVPTCVKSPGIIRLHHVAVLLFLVIPYLHPPVRYCMGACLTVELNTWFLIARRVFNKQGFPPWTVLEVSSWSPWSVRVKVISIAFYVTWIGIRCLLYPALLVPFYRHWREWSRATGTPVNILLPSVPLHASFCLLNLKWTYELIMSKVRYHRRQRRLVRSPYHNNPTGAAQQQRQQQQQQQQHHYSVDKGL